MLDLKSDYLRACSIDLMDLKRLDPINKGIKETEKRRKRGDLAPEAEAPTVGPEG